MKKLSIIFFLLLGLVTAVQAQDIVGKWKCSKEILDRLNLGYEVINGYYTFSKNGKFKLKIKGSKRITRFNTGIDQLIGNLVLQKEYRRHIHLESVGGRNHF